MPKTRTKPPAEGLAQCSRCKYLALAPVSAFCNYLERVFDGERFSHKYKIDWSQWRKHLNETPFDARRTWKYSTSRQVMSFQSLEGAYDAYYWPTETISGEDEDASDSDALTQKDNFNFAANEERLSLLREQIRKALRDADAPNTFRAAMKILDWGDVYRGSVGWLIQQYDAGRLVEQLRAAVQVLDGNELRPISRFERNGDLRMDSGMTKIYSLAAKHSIMYDGRVGAALGLLVRRFLRKNPRFRVGRDAKTKNIVPPELCFMGGGGGSDRVRNASQAGLKFPMKKTGDRHALSNLMANWVMRKVAKQSSNIWTRPTMTKKLRAMEAALFMLGYRVTPPPT